MAAGPILPVDDALSTADRRRASPSVRAWVDGERPRGVARRGRRRRRRRVRARPLADDVRGVVPGRSARPASSRRPGRSTTAGSASAREVARLIEAELAPYHLGRLNPLGLNLCAPALFAHGTEEQRRRFLPPIVRNEEKLVPALQRARRRQRPRVARDPRRARRRRLDHHRPEGVDDVGARVRLRRSCSPGPIPTSRSARASPTSSSTCTNRASTYGRSATSPARSTSTRCSSTARACPTTSASATSTTAGASPTRRSRR